MKDELIYMRWLHRGYECPAEEGLVEQLAEAWRLLSPPERTQIRGEGPQTLRRDGTVPRVMVVDTPLFAHRGTATRQLREVA